MHAMKMAAKLTWKLCLGATALGVAALAPADALAAENAAPVPQPPKAAAAAGPSPKADDAPKGTKATTSGAPGPAQSDAKPTPAPVATAADSPPPEGSAAPVPPPPAVPPKVEGGPPPLYYVEPPGGTAPAPERSATSAPEAPPPTFIYEPPLPPEPRRLVPETALWAGARVSWFVPFGSLWIDSLNSRNGLYYRRRTWGDYASSGPGLEFDIGARLARRYTVFAMMEHSFLGAGSLDTDALGGQSRGRTSFYGAGLRFSTDPTSVGFLLEIALGYREFRATWNDGTELAMTGGWLDARVGVGADIRVNKYFSLSPMIAFGGGTFGKARWSGPAGRYDALDHGDDLGEYGTFSVQLGGHFDIY